MPMKQELTRINDLIDRHGDSFTECKGCSICTEITMIRKKSERDPVKKFKHILQKGRDMTKSDIELLIDNEIPRVVISKALKMGMNHFLKMTKNLGLTRGEKSDVAKINMTVDQFVQWKYVEKLPFVEIAKRQGVADASVHYWKDKHKEAIDEALSKLGLNEQKAKAAPFKKTSKEDKSAEYEALITELKNQINNKDLDIQKLNEKVDSTIQEYEEKINYWKLNYNNLQDIHAACEDVEAELEDLKKQTNELQADCQYWRDQARLARENEKKVSDEASIFRRALKAAL